MVLLELRINCSILKKKNLGQIKGDMMYLNTTKILIFLAVVWQRTNPIPHPTPLVVYM